MPKTLRLTNKKSIAFLFTKGKEFYQHPLKAKWQINNDTNAFGVFFIISVPKKKLNAAVLRNKAKRKIREALRQNSQSLQLLLTDKCISLHLALIYQHHEVATFSAIQSSIIALLDKVINELEKNHH